MKGKLTASRTSSLRRCLRQHYYRYELGLSRIRVSTPLRLGSAFHLGLELREEYPEQDDASIINSATTDYETCPDWADPTTWAVECETVRQLLAGHFWRYQNDPLEYLTVEQTFELPLVNPETAAASRVFRLAGKFDGIVRQPDGRLAVLEYKTAGEEISPDSDYWLRLRCDGQISLYVLATRALGFDVATVLYDVTRKPTIRLRRNETPEQFGKRLLNDIGQRPDFYFQRREVPRLEDELAEFQAELWQQTQLILQIRRRATRCGDLRVAWFRNVGKLTCGYCEFAELCLNSVRVRPETPPAGFQVLDDPHPELLTQETPSP